MASFSFEANSQNAFAYDISVAATSDPSVAKITYTLNAEAKAVAVEVYNNNNKDTKLFEVAGTTSAGTNNVNISFMGKNVPLGTYWFKVRVTSKSISTPTRNSKQVMFWSPFGIAIDKNPLSDNFGRILVTEANTSLPNTSTTYHSSTANGGIGVGLYAFDPQLNGIKNSKGTYGFNGGLTMATSSDKYTNTDAYGKTYTYQMLDFMDVKYSEDFSRLFVARANTKYPGVYELDPNNLEAGAKSIFSGTTNSTTGQITNGSTIITGASHGMDVYGSGDNLKIAVLTFDYGYDINYIGEYANAYVYNLGSAKTWSSAPTATLPIDTYGSIDARWLSNEYSGILFDKDGKGVFVHQGRDLPGEMTGSTSSSDNLEDYSYIHINLTSNTADYADLDKRKLAVMAWNHDKTLLAVQNLDNTISATTGSGGKNATDGDYYYTDANKTSLTSGNAGRIKIYRVTYNNDGTHLVWGEPIYSIRTGAGKNINAIEWDYANNLYYCSNGGEYISSFAIPLSEAVATPARDEVTFNLDEALGVTDVQAVGVKTEAYTTAKSIDLTWTAPAHGTVSSYEVQCKTSSQTNWISLNASVTSTSYTYNLADDAPAGETYTFNIIPTFSTGETGPSVASNTVTDYEPSAPINVEISQQVIDGKYSFNLVVDATINDANINKTTCYGTTAIKQAKYYTVVVGEDIANITTGVTDATGNNLTLNHGTATIADKGIVKSFDAYYVQVEANDNDKSMSSVVFHNVDPQASYTIDVYLNNATAEDELNSTGWAYLNYTKATATSSGMTIPATAYNFGNATIITLDNNPAETAAADMPMGSFRNMESDEPTNAVTYNKANYIATNGGVIGALNVTDEVLANWTVTCDINLINGETVNEYNNIVATNQQQTADFTYLPISYTTDDGADGRGYNRAEETTISATITTNYSRNSNTITTTSDASELTISPTDLLPAIGSVTCNGSLIKNTKTHHNAESTTGEYWKTYYDAVLQLSWDKPEAYHLIGYYANAMQNGKTLFCWGHPTSTTSQWVQYAQGSVLTNDNIGTISTNIIEGIGFDGTNNWAELAASAGMIPLHVHYVYATNDDNKAESENATINVLLSADYPILLSAKPELVLSGVTTVDVTNPTMLVISSIPESATQLSISNVTTGVDDILIDSTYGNVKFYNLQGVEVDNPTNGIFIKVKSGNASKIILN